MKFKLYDILSHLVPGFIIYLIYLRLSNEEFDKDFVVPATAIAFVIGYFMNTLASWLEDFYYLTWGGKPSNRLLDGDDIWKIRFYDHEKAKSLLRDEYGKTNAKNDALFSVAMRYATPDVNSRVADFNANYAFSRVMLTTVFIGSGLMIYWNYDSYEVYVIAVPVVLVAWYRCKQRGYYYAREVLNTYLKVKSDR